MEYSEIFKLVHLDCFHDHRGDLRELLNESRIHALGVRNFSHTLLVTSKANVFRGMHFQFFPQGKLIFVLSGEVHLFGLDVREKSPTYRMYERRAANSISNNYAYWLPPGCAFGYRTFTEATLLYMASEPRSSNEYSIQFFDSAWNQEANLPRLHRESIISEKDELAKTLQQLEEEKILPIKMI